MSAPSRREALAGLAASAVPGAWAPSGRPPDVVIVLSDNHRWDHLGIMGHPFVETPSLDGLARDGVLFENAFVGTPLCSPSRASFLTGKYPHAHGIKNNLTPWTGEHATFLERLARLGYAAAFVGKWHMPGAGLPHLPFLDRFVSFTARGGQGLYFNCPLIVDGREEASNKEYIAEELTDRALAWVEGILGRPDRPPFVLYLSHKSVHHPYQPPRDLAGRYAHVPLPMPPGYDDWLSVTNGRIFSGTLGLLPEHWRNYCAAIVGMDREIGRLLAALDGWGLRDHTLVVYTSDNGFMWGEHRVIDMNWPYEESIRIPMIVRYPAGGAVGGRRDPRMVMNIDLAPTCLDVAGDTIPSDYQGRSLRSLLLDPALPGRDRLLFEYFKDYPYNIPTYQGVRTPTAKYVDYEGWTTDLLFDLSTDRQENVNRARDPAAADLLAAMKGHLAALRDELGIGGKSGDGP